MTGRWLRQLLDDRRGSVMAEVGILMPILVFLFLGGIEVSRYTLLQQKLNRTAVSMADLIAQSPSTINLTQVANLYEAVDYVMRPFQIGGDGLVIVSSVSRAAGGPATVNWQCEKGGAVAATSEIGASGGTATLPAGFLLRDGESAIYAEVIYNYQPYIMADLFGNHQVRHRALFRPRFGALGSLGPATGPSIDPPACT